MKKGMMRRISTGTKSKLLYTGWSQICSPGAWWWTRELKSNIVSRIMGYSRGLGDTGTHSEGEDTEESHDEDDDEDSSYGPGLGSSGTLQSEECDIKSLRVSMEWWLTAVSQ